MARASARPAGRRRARTRAARPRKPLRLAWKSYRLPLVGVGLLLLIAGLINWLLSDGALLASPREAIVEAIGVGAFAVVAALLLGSLWLLSGARRIRRQTGIHLAAGLAVAFVLLGIAGWIRPEGTLGRVPLQDTTGGGALGHALTGVPGILLWFALIGVVAAILAPQASLRALRALGTALAELGRWARAHAPRALRRLELLVYAIVRLIRRRRLWEPGDPWDQGDASRPAIPALGEMDEVIRMPAAPLAREPVETAPPPPLVDTAPTRRRARKVAPVVGEARSEGDRRSRDGWRLPPITLLHADPKPHAISNAEDKAEIIVETLGSFGVDATVTQINEGPSVTQFGVEPGWEIRTKTVLLRDPSGKTVVDDHGQPQVEDVEISRTRVRVTRITRLANDLALALAAPSIRVEAPVPGKPMIGIEVPNQERRVVSLRGVIESDTYREALAAGGLPIALGRNVTGNPVVTDLTRMPHVLIAGATGSGKSVCINSIIASLLMHFSPEELRLVMVDPKRVELTGYEHIPHLAFSRVVTDADEVVGVLGVVVAEMERRYRRFERVKARNIAAYNAMDSTEQPLPYWVVVLDELADLMLAAPVEVEQQLVRLAQLARATGIHLVVATQRPSVDVVTGLIKANFPTRIAFATTSQTDARVIMDRAGAEKLLGRGDMLFMGQDSISARRVQGTYVSDDEINSIIDFWTRGRSRDVDRPTLEALIEQLLPDSETARAIAEGAAVDTDARNARAVLAAASTRVPVPTEDDEDDEDVVAGWAGTEQPARADRPSTILRSDAAAARGSDGDSLLGEATELAREHTRISASLLQRRLRIGHPRAVRLIEELEAAGVVAASEGGPSRLVLLHD